MKSKRTAPPSASRLIGIVSSVTGVDIMESTRKRAVVDGRAIFYKIYRDMEGWSFADIGALFGKDHATVIHGINAIELFMTQDNRIKMVYERCNKLYHGESSVEDYLDKPDLIQKITQLDGRILDLNAYIAELKGKIKRISNKDTELSGLYEVIKMHTPAGKIEDAKKKVRAVLNGL